MAQIVSFNSLPPDDRYLGNKILTAPKGVDACVILSNDGTKILVALERNVLAIDESGRPGIKRQVDDVFWMNYNCNLAFLPVIFPKPQADAILQLAENLETAEGSLWGAGGDDV